MANMYAFAEDPVHVAEYRQMLAEELHEMKDEYDALLYGGKVATVVSATRVAWGIVMRVHPGRGGFA
jgi:ribosomal protein L35AE/L33A